MPDWRRRRFAASKPIPNSGDDVDLGKNYQPSTINCCRFADIYIQEFISAEDSRRYNRASFCFEII
jgi:hypothetical protein